MAETRYRLAPDRAVDRQALADLYAAAFAGEDLLPLVMGLLPRPAGRILFLLPNAAASF